MAKRRLNLPLFIVLFAAIVAMTGAGAVLWYKRFRSRDPEPKIQLADRAEADGRFEEAARNYAYAFVYDTRRNEREQWGIRRGDLLRVLGYEPQAGKAYTDVLKHYPDCWRAQQRLVELTLFQVEAYGKAVFPRLGEVATDLLRISPNNPLAYRARAIANQGLGGAGKVLEALEDFAKLRELDPNDPTGYFYPALILADRPEKTTTAPDYDPARADRLISFVPPNAPAPLLSRFRLYQALYHVSLLREREEGVETAKKLMAEITDFSRMTRGEQARLAWLAEKIGTIVNLSQFKSDTSGSTEGNPYFALVEKIYRSWDNDQAAQLAELKDPPVRAEVLAALRAKCPKSLVGAAKLAEFYLNTGQTSKAEDLIAVGLEIPVLAGGMVGGLQGFQRYTLMTCRAKILLMNADMHTDPKERLDSYHQVNDFLEKMGHEYARVVETNPEWHRLAGLSALNLRRYALAQHHLEISWNLLQNMDPGRTAPERLSTALLLVEAYRQLSQFGSAYNLLMDRSLLAYHSNPRVRLTLARLALELPDYETVLGLTRKLVAEDPTLTEAKRLQVRALRMMGGEKNLEEANRIDEQLETSKAVRLLRSAMAAFQAKDYRRTIEECNAALAEDPGYWDAALTLAHAYKSSNQKDRALAALAEFSKNYPDNKNAQVAMIYFEKGARAAEDLFRKIRAEEETPVQKALRLAVEAAERRDRDQARKRLEEAERLAATPDQKIQAQLAGFDLAIHQEDFLSAWRCLDPLEKANIDGIGGLTLRARLLFSEKNWEDAIRAYQEVLKRKISDSHSRYMLAIATVNSNSTRESWMLAVDHLRQAVRENPRHRQAWQALVQALHNLNRKQEAWQVAEEGLKRLESDPYLEQVRLEQLAAQEPKKAIDKRLKIKDENPNDWENLRALGLLYILQKQNQDAEPLLVEALAKAPDNEKLRLTMQVAEFYRRQDKPAEGEKIIGQYLDKHRNDPSANQAMAEYLKTLERFEEAEVYYRNAVSISPAPFRFVSLSDFYRRWPKHEDQAIEALRAAVVRAEGAMKAEIQQRLVETLLTCNRLDDAAATVADYKKAWPGDLLGELLEGGVKMAQGQHASAIELFDRVLQQRPDSPTAYFWKGKAIYLANPAANIGPAIDCLKAAVARDPTVHNNEASLLLAMMYAERGETKEAIRAYQRLLNREPTVLEARVRLLRLLRETGQDRELAFELAEAQKLGIGQVPSFIIEAANAAHREGRLAATSNPTASKAKLVEAEKGFREAMAVDPSPVPILGLCRSLAAQERWKDVADEAAKWDQAAKFKSVDVLIQRVLALAQLKQYDPMLESMQAAIELSEMEPLLVQHFGAKIKSDLPAEDRRKATMDAFVAAKPDSLTRQLMRLSVLGAENKFDEALDQLEELARKVESDEQKKKDVLLNQAMVAQRAGHLLAGAAADGYSRRAAGYYQQLLKLIKPDKASVTVLNNYAYLLANNLNQADEAIPLAEMAMRRSMVRDPNLLDTIGWCYVKNGEITKGISVLEEARMVVTNRKESSPVILYHLAAAYDMQKGDEKSRENAIKWAKRAIEDGADRPKDQPENEYVKLAAELLRRHGEKAP